MNPTILQVVFEMTNAGYRPYDIAPALRVQFGLNQLQAMRLAHSWSQRDAADAWNARWPDDIKTFKNFSYWECWFDSPETGYSASLGVLANLAQLYQCNVADLLDGFGNYRSVTEVTRPAWNSLVAPPSGVSPRLAAAGLARAHTLYAEVTARWPHLWRSLDQVRKERPGPWPAWCLLPTPAVALLLGSAGPIHAVSALYAWRYTRSAYIYPAEVGRELVLKQPDILDHTKPLQLLAEWCVYVAADADRPGVWAYLERDHSHDAVVLRLLIDPATGGIDDLVPMAVPLGQPLGEAENHAHRSNDRRVRVYADLLGGFASLVTYPATPSATVVPYGDAQRALGRVVIPPDHDIIWIPKDRRRPAGSDPLLVDPAESEGPDLPNDGPAN